MGSFRVAVWATITCILLWSFQWIPLKIFSCKTVQSFKASQYGLINGTCTASVQQLIRSLSRVHRAEDARDHHQVLLQSRTEVVPSVPSYWARGADAYFSASLRAALSAFSISKWRNPVKEKKRRSFWSGTNSLKVTKLHRNRLTLTLTMKVPLKHVPIHKALNIKMMAPPTKVLL